MKHTTHFALNKPDGNDWADIGVLNQNADAIDAALKAAQDHQGATGNAHHATAADMGAIPASEKGAPDGVAALDESGKVPSSQLPAMDYDPAGSAAGVEQQVLAHLLDGENPHHVTAAQVGADAAGSADTVQAALDGHAADTEQAHGIGVVRTMSQGADNKADVLRAELEQLKNAIYSDITANPWSVTFSDLSGVARTKGNWNRDQQRLEC